MHPIASTLGGLYPTSVVVHALAYDERQPPKEFAFPASLASSVPKRRAEFAAGRECAHAALAVLGCPRREIGIGAMRAPVWPLGFVGSISHAAGVAAAVAAPAGVATSLGLDIEKIVSAELVATLSANVATADEVARVGRLMADPAAAFTVIFAAKEALFKCVAPLVGRYFDFLDAEVYSARDGVLSLRLRIDLGPAFPAGRTFDVKIACAIPFLVAGATIEPH